MKSSSRNTTEGTLDKIAGRVMELFAKLTGRKSTMVKGRAARARGAGRRRTGKTKRAFR